MQNQEVFHSHQLQSSNNNHNYVRITQPCWKILNILDRCKQIVREDRLFLRQRIQAYYKLNTSLISQEEELISLQQLIKIFQLPNNSTQYFNKLTNNSQLMSLIQVNLRKYIINYRKQKYQQQVNKFTRKMESKGSHISRIAQKSLKKSNEPKELISQYDYKSMLSSNINHSIDQIKNKNLNVKQICINDRNSRLSLINRKCKIIQSDCDKIHKKSISKQKSDSSQKQPKAFTYLLQRFHQNKNIKQLRRSKIELSTKIDNNLRQIKYKTPKNINSDNLGSNILLNLSDQSKLRNKAQISGRRKSLKNRIEFKTYQNQRNKQSQQNYFMIKQQYQKQLNNQKKYFQKSIIKNKKNKMESSSSQFNQSISDANQHKKEYHNSHLRNYNKQFQRPSSNNHSYHSLSYIQQYEQSARKLQQMLEESKNALKQINNANINCNEDLMHTFMPKNQENYKFNNTNENLLDNVQMISSLKQSQDTEKDTCIFTPLHLLEECRNYTRTEINQSKIQKESKLQQSQFNLYSQQNSQKKQKIFEHVNLQPSFNSIQYKNIKNSQKFKNKTPQTLFSPHKTSLDTITIKASIIGKIQQADALLYRLFDQSVILELKEQDIPQIMGQISDGLQESTSLFFKSNQRKSNEMKKIDFIQGCTLYYKFGLLVLSKQCLCKKLMRILDMDNKSYVTKSDIEIFKRNLQASELGQPLIQELYSLLQIIFLQAYLIEQKCRQNNIELQELSSIPYLTLWSLFYLQLKNANSMIQMQRILNDIDFEIQTDTKDHTDLKQPLKQQQL